MGNKFKIIGPIFIGRSYDEYLKMFNLDPLKIQYEKILDCAAGASSFTAIMNENGFNVKAVDILYDKDPAFLQKRCKYHLNALVESLSEMETHFKWDFFKNLDELKNKRIETCNRFFRDYKINKNNYINADLLNLPFKKDSFTTVLSSHLFFIYDHRLNYNFHLQGIKEMLRVTTNDVLIYPLVKHRSIKSKYVKMIMDDLNNAEIKIEKVNYEFRKGADEMMRISKLN